MEFTGASHPMVEVELKLRNHESNNLNNYSTDFIGIYPCP